MQQAKNKNTSIARGISGKIKSCLLYKTHITYEGIQTLYVYVVMNMKTHSINEHLERKWKAEDMKVNLSFMNP